MSRLIISISLIAILHACSTSDRNQVLQEVPFRGGVLTEIHIENIPAEVQQIKLSELLDNFRFIPLETNEKCLISNTKIHFSEDYIFVGTQNFPGTAKLYRFDRSGNFIDEIGKAGRGPEENEGTIVDEINFYNDNRTILAKWDGIRDNPQIYDDNGTLLFEISQPGRFSNIYRWSESAWFSTGSLAGYPSTLRDSIALLFYDKEGNIKNQIPRRTYPPDNARGHSPFSWSPSIYNYKDHKMLYLHGNDTVFTIVDMELMPYAVMVPTADAMPFNKTINPEQLSGKYYLTIISENEHNWHIIKTIVKKADLLEFQPGSWGGSYDAENQYIIVDKKSNKAIRAKLIDDIFHMIPEEYLSMGLLEWQDNTIYFALPPYVIKDLTENVSLEDITNESVKEFMEQLKYIPAEDNPIIFTFSIKEPFTMPDV